MSVQLFSCAVIAALSPLAAAATLAVIPSGRAKALAFGLGVLAGQLLACGILVLIGAALTPGRDHQYPSLRNALELALGVALLGAATFVRSRTNDSRIASTGRADSLLARLRRVGVATTASVGVLLGIGGPKRLVLTTFASATITASGTEGVHAAVLVFVYSLVATLLIWLPIVVFEIAGNRVTPALHAAQRWLVGHERPLAFYSFLALGSFAIVDSLAKIF